MNQKNKRLLAYIVGGAVAFFTGYLLAWILT